MRTHANEWTTSYLLIHDADINDSGVYVCAPTSGGRTSIKVHVFLHGNNAHSMWQNQHKAFIILLLFHTFPYKTYIYFVQANSNFISFFSQPFRIRIDSYSCAFILFLYLFNLRITFGRLCRRKTRSDANWHINVLHRK